MKIGLYGGMCNNLYVLGKVLHAHGSDVLFVRDRGDSYPMSQPVWEDVEVTLPYEEFSDARWSAERWDEFERAHRWSAPTWVVDPRGAGPRDRRGRLAALVLRLGLGGGGGPTAHLPAAAHALRGCDVLVVCGMEGELLAACLDRPYVALAHGGDIQLAGGQVSPPLGRRARLCRPFREASLRFAFRRAAWVASQDPNGFAGRVDENNLLPWLDLRLLALPYAIRPRAPRAEREASLRTLLGRFGCEPPKARFTLFVPSRFDYAWKGQDQVLRALARQTPGDFHVIFSGWGVDYAAGKTLVAELGLEEQTTFLSGAMSKPLLLQLFGAVDLVIDQFVIGIYGTSMVEAMSCGTPVLMRINVPAFDRKGWEPPPVLNAESADQIAAHLDAVARGSLDLRDVARRQVDWVERVHGAAHVAETLPARLAKLIRD